MAGDADELQAARAIGAGGFVPVDATSEDLRHVGESFDVVDDGGLLEESGLAGEGRLIARLGAMAFNGFEERGFFAADIATRANKDFEIEVEIAAENFLSDEAGFGAAANFFAEDFFLQRVFMADIEDTFFCASDESGDDHAFGNEMREMGEDEAIFNGAGFALVGVADDVFVRIGLLADKVPLHPGGKTGAAHAAELCFLESGEDRVEIARGDQFAQDAVFLVVGVGVGAAADARGLGMIGMGLLAAGGTARELFDLIGIDGVENRIVDRDGWCAITTAETAYVLQLDFIWTRIGEAARKFGAKITGAIQPAAHVGANQDFGVGRWREMEVRTETGDAVELVERGLRALGQGFEFGLRQIAAPQLDSAQFVEDHRSVGSRIRAPAVKHGRGKGLGYLRTGGRGNEAKIAGRCLFAQRAEKGPQRHKDLRGNWTLYVS